MCLLFLWTFPTGSLYDPDLSLLPSTLEVYPLTIDPLHEFKTELECISSDDHRAIAFAGLHAAPEYFWTVPASSSGSFHPKNSLGIGGLTRHVKGVFWMGEELLAHPTLYAHFTEEEKNDIRVAFLLHDCAKQGLQCHDNTHTVHEHPLLIRAGLEPVGMSEVQEAIWDRVCSLIESHMGPWTTDRKEVSALTLPEPITEQQKFVHMCDYLASRKNIEVDVFDRTPQKNYVAKEDPATVSQVNFIAKLCDQLRAKNKDMSRWSSITISENDKIVIGKKTASIVIDEMKAALQ